MKISQELLYMSCPCESGKKFKFCCLEKVQDGLPFNPDKNDIVMAVRKCMQPYGMVNDVDPSEDRESIQIMIQALKERNEGHIETAYNLFVEARTKNPRLYTAWNNEAQLLWTFGELDAAITIQKEGLTFSNECNSYGWAQLAEFYYFLTQDDEYNNSLEKAVAIPPITQDATAKVCVALALQKRHRDIVTYVEMSGFEQAAPVAYYLTIALLNMGEFQKAKEAFTRGNVRAFGMMGLLAKVLVEMAEHGHLPEMLMSYVDREVPYFSFPHYEAGPLAGHVFAYPRAAYENVACDMVDFSLSDKIVSKEDALEALSNFQGKRAKHLCDLIHLMPDYTMPKSYKSGTIGGELAIQRALEKEEEFTPVCFNFNLESIPEEFENELDSIQMMEALFNIDDARKNSKAWCEAFETLHALCEKHPTHCRLKSRYAYSLLDANRAEEAFNLLQDTLKDGSDLTVVYPPMIEAAVRLERLDIAEHCIQEFEMPLAMNAFIYLNWQNALKAYYKAIGDKERQKVAMRRARLARQLIDEEGETF